MKGRNSKVEISPLCLPSFPPPIFLLFYGSCKHLLETYLISKNEVRRRQTWPLSLAHLQNLHDKQRNPADLRKSEGYEDSVWQGKPQTSFCYTKIQDVKTAGSRT